MPSPTTASTIVRRLRVTRLCAERTATRTSASWPGTRSATRASFVRSTHRRGIRRQHVEHRLDADRVQGLPLAFADALQQARVELVELAQRDRRLLGHSTPKRNG